METVTRLWHEQGDHLAAKYGSEYDSRDIKEYIGQAIAVVRGSG
jgi:hypothetical protein